MPEIKEKSGLKFIDRDMIKYIIVFIMFWGHLFAWLSIGDTPPDGLFTDVPWWQWIPIRLSLMTPPVMFFFVADGFRYTRSRKKYAVRLLLFGCITQIPYYLLWYPLYGWWNFNVMFSLFFGLLALCAWESGFKKWQRIGLVILCCLGTLALQSEWMVFAPVVILGLHIFREKPKARFIWYASVWTLHLVITAIGYLSDGFSFVETASVLLYTFDFLAAYALMTVFYSGRKGRFPVFSKWFFYIFYPAHILLAVILRHI